MAGQVRIGTPDASLTSASGVVAVAELVGRLGVVDAFDDAVGSIKQRDRGLTAGQFLVSLAQAQMLGLGEFEAELAAHRQVLLGPIPDRGHHAPTGQGRANVRNASWSTLA